MSHTPHPHRGLAWIALLVFVSGLEAATAGEPGVPAVNVLLITLDTTRADHLSAYGYAKKTSPRLDALASEGVRFERAISTSAVTPISHASILTGQNPYRHGLRVFYGPVGHFLTPDQPTLASFLASRGWSTGGFVSSLPASERFGLDHGFETFRSGLSDEVLETDPRRKSPTDGKWLRERTASAQRRGDATTDEALAWWKGSKKPRFMWVHYFDPHDPSLIPPSEITEAFDLPPQGERKWFDVYDAEIYFMDQQIGRLIDMLKETGEYANTVVVVVADHGQGMGDHGWRQHRLLYEEQIRVPLILRHPGGPEGRVVEQVVRAIDVLPTILDVLGLEGPPVEGTSLLATLGDGPKTPRIAYAEALNTLDSHSPAKLPERHKDLLFVATDGDWKLIHHRDVPANDELYHLAKDPREQSNVASEHPEQVDRLLKWLRASGALDIELQETVEPMDPETREQLRALGYGD